MRESVRGKPLFARAAVTMIRHFLDISNDAVTYKPLLMLPEFYVHGGTRAAHTWCTMLGVMATWRPIVLQMNPWKAV